MKVTLASIFFIGSVILCYAQKAIPLATNMGEWSPFETFVLTNHSEGPSIQLRSKVLNFDLTSGEIELEITNTSAKSIDFQFGIKPTTGSLYDGILNIEEAYRCRNLLSGDTITLTMTLRGCVLRNSRKTDGMKRVENCRPKILFLKGWLND